MRSLSLLATAVVLLGQQAHAQLPKTFHATLESVDARVGSITVRRIEEKPKPITLNLLRADLPVTDAHDQPLKLDDLRPRDRLVVTMASDEDVSALRQESDVLWGLVVRYDAGTQSLHCKFGIADRALRLTPEVKLVADGQPAGPDAFPPGRPVNVLYSRDHAKVVEVRAGKGITQYHPYGRLRYQPALLLEADHTRRRLKVVVTEERYQPREYEYDGWTSLLLAHGDRSIKTEAITALRPYCKMTLFIETDTQRVFHVRADLPTVNRRKVTAIDHAARKLTLAGEDDAAELTVAADALLNGPQGKVNWEEIRVGDLVTCSLSFDGDQVLYLLLWPR